MQGHDPSAAARGYDTEQGVWVKPPRHDRGRPNNDPVPTRAGKPRADGHLGESRGTHRSGGTQTQKNVKRRTDLAHSFCHNICLNQV